MARQHIFRTLTGVGAGLAIALLGTALAEEDILHSSSIGAAGIDALRLHNPPYRLTGRKIAIGQVEIGRPGQFGIDKAVAQNRTVPLTRVFYRNAPARINTNVDGHAQNVASIMISAAKAMRGVAPGARLYSSAAGTPKRYGQPEECLSTQHIAMQNGGDVRAINFSFGEALRQDPRSRPLLDGNALLTQCVDWSARVHNVLYVVAGNQGKGGISIPTDNYNGINVAFTTRIEGIFRKVDFANLGDPSGSGSTIAGVESNVGPRRAIGLVAPGNEIAMVALNGNLTNSSGTSFAAPHVTATAALLQEYSDRQLRLNCKPTGCALPWSLDARRHEVMKAVLLNSTDKLKDNGSGLNLGMSRTILDKNNHTWIESDAYKNPKLPLNVQMGTGQLNAFRAYQQFSPGQWSPDAAVPAIGWDYRTVSLSGEGGRGDAGTRGRGDGRSFESTVLSSELTSQTQNSLAEQPKALFKTQNSLAKRRKALLKTQNSPTPSFRDYVLEKPLKKGSFVSITLTWDRLAELVDKNKNGEFDMGESFRDRGLNNLDIYLMRADETDTRRSVWSSVSEVDSVEHIFHQVPETGQYKIRVVFQKRLNDAVQAYALAWWTVPD